ncbi:hypothetical protein [Piscirickettsia salmonis]|uniref:hypothetical protein n=1 Tax=Piscirickettsia salmonis TaxID=1238 RepID=UPI003A7F82FB
MNMNSLLSVALQMTEGGLMRDTKIFIAVSKAFQFFRLLQKDLFSVTGIVNDFENKDVKINYQIYGKRDTIFTKSAKEIAEDYSATVSQDKSFN